MGLLPFTEVPLYAGIYVQPVKRLHVNACVIGVIIPFFYPFIPPEERLKAERFLKPPLVVKGEKQDMKIVHY